MTRIRTCLLKILICSILFIGISDCATTEPARFFILEPIKTQGSVAKADISVGIGPLTIADHLDRPQIVTRTNDTQLRFDEFERWAEPLDNNLSTVIRDNLMNLLGTDNVKSYPWPQSARPDYQVIINIDRFDVSKDKGARLVVNWTVTGKNGEIIVKKSSVYEEGSKTAGFPSYVKALNKTIDRFSGDISSAIEKSH